MRITSQKLSKIFLGPAVKVVIRVNDAGLQEAANCTRLWLTMAGPHFALPDMRQVFVNPFAAGEIIVRNITVDRFVPPQIRFRLGNSTVQMLTHSGYVQAAADWELRSELLSVLEVPLVGTIRIQMTGLISEIDMEVVLTQSLEAIVLSQEHIDLEMRSDLVWNDTEPSTRMITIFVEEETMQNILKAAHYAGHFITTVESPFLKTQCDVLCIGTMLPELSEAMPNTSLIAQVSTLTAPVISLYDSQAVVFVNASLNILAKSASNEADGMLVSINVVTEFILELAIDKGWTVDLLVEMSTPFVEDAIELLLHRGIPVSSLFQFPTKNELLTVHGKFLKLETDIDFPIRLLHKWPFAICSIHQNANSQKIWKQ
ncbi:LBP / BPI / CETP family protein [Teladorsagia circumcincta]|uniref:LBP / BPI / CETP family protein n=1 Tax=Teladorsagia circumcincta TaxID=45464 RepID=A0A2G9V3A3_TELCI|nr:LBP / BPI / CETP family protein [Teladorsagia circumcincta]